MSPLAWLGFVVAGAIGAPARYVLDDAISSRALGVFPWGTLVINVSGSFIRLVNFARCLGKRHRSRRSIHIIFITSRWGENGLAST